MNVKIAPPLWTGSFVMLCLCSIIVSMSFYMSMPVFPLLLEDEFALGKLAVGVVVASYTAAAILTRPPTGYALDRFGRKKLLLVSYTVFGAIYLLYPLIEGGWSAFLVRFAHGALWGVSMGALATTVVDLLPQSRRGEGIGYYGLGMILGMSSGPGIGLYVLEHYGFAVLFKAASFLTLAGLPLLLLVKFPDVPKRVQAFSLPLLLEKSSLPTSMALLFFCMPYGIIMNFTAAFSRTVPGADAGVFFIFLALGTALARLFSGRAFDQIGPGRIMIFAYTSMIAGCCLQVFTEGLYFFTTAGLLFGLGYGMAVPVTQAMVNALVPADKRGAANATYMTSFDLGIFLGIVLGSGIQLFCGWRLVYGLLLCLYIISVVIFFQLSLPHYKDGKSGTL